VQAEGKQFQRPFFRCSEGKPLILTATDLTEMPGPRLRANRNIGEHCAARRYAENDLSEEWVVGYFVFHWICL